MAADPQTYIICATQRSGSTLLCHYLSNLKFAGFPREHLLPRNLESFQAPGEPFCETIQKIMNHHRSDNGVSGVKIMNNTWAEMMAELRRSPQFSDCSDRQLINQVFPDVKFIFITRQNKLRQAISLSKAEYSKTWERHSDAQEKKPTVRNLLHPFYLKSALTRVHEREQYWVDYLKDHALPHLTLSYEDLVKNPVEIIKSTLAFLEIDYPADLEINQGSLTKQSDIYTELLMFYYHCYFFLYNHLPKKAFSGLRWLKHLILAT